MASAGTVTVDFAAETAKFTAELKKVNSRLKSLEGGFDKIARVARGAIGALSIGAVTAFAKASADAAEKLGQTSDAIGVSTDNLKAFQIAAEEAGVGVTQANKLLVEGQTRLGQAAAGTGEAAKFIKALNLDITELQRLAPDELFRVYSESILDLSTRSEQLAAANALMGESAREAFVLIQAGNPALDEAAAFVERYGLALDRVDIAQIEQANDAIGRLGTISQSAGQQITAGLAPFVEEFANRMLGITGSTETLQTRAAQFGAVLQTAFEIAANAVRSLQAAFFGLAAGVARVFQFLTFGDVSDSFAAAVDANLAKAQGALDQIKSIEQIQEGIVRALEESRARAEEAVAAQQAAAGGGTLTLDGGLGLDQEQNFEIANAAAAAAAEAQKEIMKDLTDFTEEELTRRAEISNNIRELDRAREAASMQFMVDVRTNAFNSIIGGLQAFSGKSKKIAIALVALNKGMAIAKALQDGYVAVQAALAYVPYPANLAAAAQMKVLTALNVAGIIASGIGQIQQINSSAGSGAPIGSPVNPVFTQPTSADQDFGATSQRAVQVVIANNVGFDQRVMDQIIAGIREAADDRDVIIFGPASRQAQELGLA